MIVLKVIVIVIAITSGLVVLACLKLSGKISEEERRKNENNY